MEDRPAKSLGEASTRAEAVRSEPGSSVGDQPTAAGVGDGDQAFGQTVELETRYEIQGIIGSGGMGQVLQAVDRRLGRPVAIKRLRRALSGSPEAVQRFLTEARSIAAVNHPHIIDVYDYGRDAEGPFLVMEWIDGESLAGWLERGPLGLSVAVNLVCKVCGGLEHAHGHGIIHRDIKPANILLDREETPHLSDFGLARLDSGDSGQTRTGMALGTLDYMAPEQRTDATRADTRSDLWSLAATLYEMVTGEIPRVIELDRLPPRLGTFLERALQTEPDRRFQTAGSFRRGLESVLSTGADARPVVVDGADVASRACPACGERNPHELKFCGGCGVEVADPCLGCGTAIGRTEKFCGRCGAGVEELLQQKLEECRGWKAEAERLLEQEAFTEAIGLAAQLAAIGHPKLAEFQAWGEQTRSTLEEGLVEQELHRDRLLTRARAHFRAAEFDDVLELLEQIPARFRGQSVAELQQAAASRQEELQVLTREIHAAVRSEQYIGLLAKTERFMELCPGDARIAELHEKLMKRAAAHRQQALELLAAAEAHYDVYDDSAALTALKQVHPLLVDSRVEKLLEQARSRLARVRELSARIREATKSGDLDGLLPTVRQLLKLRPGNAEARSLLRQLKNRQAEQDDSGWWPLVVSHRTRILQVFGGAVAVVVVVIVMTGNSWFSSPGMIDSSGVGVSSSVMTIRLPYDVLGAAISHDGAQVATGGASVSVQLWDAWTGKETLKLRGGRGFPYSVAGLAFSPDGTRLFTGAREFERGDLREAGLLTMWSTLTGREVFSHKGHNKWIYGVAISPDGTKLATASGDGTVKLWNAVTGSELDALGGHTGIVRSVVFGPNGRWLASGGDDRTVKLWSVGTGALVQSFKQPRAGVRGVAFSRAGALLAAVVADGALYMFRTGLFRTGNESSMGFFEAHRGSVNCVAFSPDGRQLATGGSDSNVKVWDLGTLVHMRTLKGHSGGVRTVAFNSDGSTLVSSSDDKTVRIWGMEVRRDEGALEILPKKLEQPVPGGRNSRIGPPADPTDSPGHGPGLEPVLFSRDRPVAATSARRREVVPEVLVIKGYTSRVSSMSFNGDGKRLATAGEGGFVRIWDTATGERELTIEAHVGAVSAVAFSPARASSAVLASSGEDTTVKLWNTVTDRKLLSITGHMARVCCVVISPDGRRLASGDNKTVRLWDATTGNSAGRLTGHTGAINRIVFSSDGRQLASCGEDKTVRLWDLMDKRETRTLEHAAAVRSVAFSPDGNRVASGDAASKTTAWDAASGREVFARADHAGVVRAVVFSPDGKWLITAGGGFGSPGEVRVRDASSGEIIIDLSGHGDYVLCLAISRDGRRLASAGYDKTVRLWNLAGVARGR